LTWVLIIIIISITFIGDNAGNQAMHNWVKKHKGIPKYCEHCKRTDKGAYHWANIDHKYKRNLDDYIRLCVSCHNKYDYKFNGCRHHHKITRQINISKNNKSGFNGVCYDKSRNKWIAHLTVRNISYRKRLETKEEAIKTRKKFEQCNSINYK